MSGAKQIQLCLLPEKDPLAPAGPAQPKRGKGGADGKIAKRPRTQRPRAGADRDSVTAPSSVASAAQVPPPG